MAHPVTRAPLLPSHVCVPSTVLPRSQPTRVGFVADEIIVQVYGRAGLQAYYNQSLLMQVSFVILNKKTVTTHVAGVITYHPIGCM